MHVNDGDEDLRHAGGCGSVADANGDDCGGSLEDPRENDHAGGVDGARERAHVFRPRADDDGRVVR